MRKIKVVIDTNVFISGIFWKGYSYKVLKLWKEGKMINYTFLSIINEIAEDLRDFRINMAEEDIYSLCGMIAENSVVLIEFGILNYPVRDATDNKFIQCAIEGKVDYIITQDHLCPIKK